MSGLLPDWHGWVFELEQFFQTGGWVLYSILVVCFALSTLILERLVFRMITWRGFKKKLLLQLTEETDWRIKRSILSDLEQALKDQFPLIKTLITLCPLVGLLGTVSGMIQVFDSLAIYGTGNPRTMASGVASATFPTMTGMAVAVAGLLFYSQLQRWAEKEWESLLTTSYLSSG